MLFVLDLVRIGFGFAYRIHNANRAFR
jgi:hypothetical protein